MSDVFKFKQFDIQQGNSAMKVGTDSIILGALVDCSDSMLGLDIGAGTGVLSLMIAQKNTNLEIDAVEISDQAFIDLRQNCYNYSAPNQLNYFLGSISEFTRTTKKKYDLIFSNPPYFKFNPAGKRSNRSIARQELTLNAAELLNCVSALLTLNGTFWVIIPSHRLREYRQHMSIFNLFINKQVNIKPREHNQANRHVLSVSRKASNITATELVIRDDVGYTEQYEQLTQDYYFNDLNKCKKP